MATITEKDLRQLEYLSRETGEYHHPSKQEAYLTQLLLAGDEVLLNKLSLDDDSVHHGHLASDPLQRIRYLFVAGTTVTTRAAIAAGLDEERAYNISDTFIYRMDQSSARPQIEALFREEAVFFMQEIQAMKRRKIFSRAVARGLEYITKNLHRAIPVADVAAHAGLSPSYFAEQFKKETGSSVAAYILEQKVDAAKNMLRYSEMSYAEISTTLAFSSQSYFIHVFKRSVGITPGQYRKWQH